MTNEVIIVIEFMLEFFTAAVMIRALLRDRHQNGMVYFFGMGLCVLGWLISATLFSLSKDSEWARFFFDLKIPFVAFMAVFSLFFTLRYYRMDKTMGRFVRLLICLVPSATAVIALTSAHHTLLREVLSVFITQPRHTVVNVQGIWYWVHSVYSYALIITAFVILVYRNRCMPKAYRRPSLLLIAAIVCTIVSNLISITVWRSIGFDLTMPGMCVSLALIYLAIISGDTANFLAMARGEIFHYIDDRIFILDNDRRVMDLNRAARNWLGEIGVTEEYPYFEDITGRLKTAGLTSGQESQDPGDMEVYVAQTPGLAVYQIHERSVLDRRGKQIGMFVTFTDVTRFRVLIDRMEHIVGVDPLTSIGNRNRYNQRRKEMDTPEHMPLSVMVGDVNHLKYVNDTMGHLHGDRLLQTCARVLGDVVNGRGELFRVGGDEFIALLPQTDKEAAEELGKELGDKLKDVADLEIPPSISVGFNAKTREDQDLTEIIREADLSMYANKEVDRRKGPSDRRK